MHVNKIELWWRIVPYKGHENGEQYLRKKIPQVGWREVGVPFDLIDDEQQTYAYKRFGKYSV